MGKATNDESTTNLFPGPFHPRESPTAQGLYPYLHSAQVTLQDRYPRLVSARRMSSSVHPNQTAREVRPHDVSDTKHVDKADGDLVRFPEGGTAAWCTVIGAALVQFCGFGYTSSFGVYQDFYTLRYLTNESASAISWVGSVNAFLATGFGPISGALYDRGYFYHLLIGGSLLQSFTLFMLSLTQPGRYYQIFLAQGIGLGIAQGIMYIPTMAVVSHYFRQHRTLAMSLVASGSSFGSIIHPIMLNNLFNRSVGFGNGVRISAAFVSVLLLVACLLMRTRLEPPRHRANYLSVGRGIIHDVPFCIMSVGLLCFQIGFFFPLFYLQLDSVRHGNSETFSFYSLVLLNGGGLIGRLSTGFIAPRVGVPRFMIISTAGCGILILGMIGLSSAPTVVMLGTVYGYFAGVYIALLSPLMTLLTTDLSELGARMGIGIAVVGIGSLIGGPVSGALLTSRYKWWQPSLFSGLICLTGSLLLMVMQLALTRRKRLAERQKP
ncbi:major facilitator superfamily domain-containing protein [Butyriboletus roseoflavus]|nr:major facilitator superfamily domain-containing protein [Butyriboletus roseoflavus]